MGNSENTNSTAIPDFTSGSIIKSIITLSIPIILAQLLQAAYQLIDTFWVGRLGAEAVAAVSLSFPIFFLLMSFGGGLAIAGTILVAQYKGKKDYDNVDEVTGQTFLMMFLAGVIIMFVGIFLSEPILDSMGADDVVFSQASSYLQISFLGLPCMFLYFAYQSLMRGVGDVKTPLYIVFGTVVLNTILDPLFITGIGILPGWGVAGAALVTVISQTLGAVIGIGLLLKGRSGIRLKLRNFKFKFGVIKKMFVIGMPSSIEQTMRALGMIVMTFLVATFGTMVVAAYGIGIRIFSLIIIPAIGISMATATLVGQNIGAGKIDRADDIAKKAGLFSFLVLFIVGVVVFIFASEITIFLLPGAKAVTDSATLFVRLLACVFGFVGLQQAIYGAFTGSGNTKITMIFGVISLWILQFPLAYFLSRYTAMGELGIWVSLPISNFVCVVLAFIYFLMGRWKNTRVIDAREK